MKFILGKKIGCFQIFDDKGELLPATLVQAGPCFVLRAKTKEKDGYDSVQIGFEEIIAKGVKKTKKYRYLKEFRLKGAADKQVKQAGQENNGGESIITVKIFQEGEKVKVSGISKGKGFQGAVKRWGFHGKNSSHGTKHEQRTLGSVGCRFPQRVVKGKKMPGRTGSERVTIRNIQVIAIDEADNILMLKGSVPGRKGALLEIKS